MADLTDELAAAQARLQAANARAAALGPGAAANVADLYRVYPSLRGAAVPLGAAGVRADTSVARRAAERKAAKDARKPKPGQEVSGGFLSNVWSTVKDAARATTRYGTAALAAPYEYLEGTFREGYGGLKRGDYRAAAAPFGLAGTILSGKADNALRQTTLASTIGRDTGSGWFIGPDTEAGKEQARRARAAGLIGGRAITPGRAAASTFLEPGTGAYNTLSGLVDLGSTLAFDPLTYVGGGVAKANRGRKLLAKGPMVERDLPTKVSKAGGIQPTMVAGPKGTSRVMVAENAGLVDGAPRPTVLPQKAWAWLDSDAGQAVIKNLAETGDYNKIWRGTGKKLDAELVLALKDTKDEALVKNLLVDAIGNGAVRERMVFKAKKAPPRLAGMMPGSKIDLEDLNDAVEQFDRFQRNALVPEDLISRNNEAFVRAGTGGGRFAVVKEAADAISMVLQRKGASEFEANRMTRLWQDAFDDARKYSVDEIGDNARIPGVVIDGAGKALPAPHLSVELLDRFIPLPNARELKAANRSLGVIRKVESHLGYRVARDVADFINNDIFKVTALALRPAWAVRVVGEEQIRMGAAGLTSAFRHPLSYISWVAGSDSGRLNKLLVGGKGGVDVLGEKFSEAAQGELSRFQQAMNRGSAGWRDKMGVLTRHWTTYSKNEEPYVESWLDELTQLASAPEAREAARNATRAKDMFWDGSLARLREEMRTAQPNLGLDTREGSDAFMDTVVDRIKVKTRGRPDLLRAVAHGNLGGHPLTVETSPTKGALDYLAKLRDEGVGPERVKGRIKGYAVGESNTKKALEHYDRAVEALFNTLGSRPTNYLSRSPTFRQYYWKRAEELAPLLTRQDRVRLARAAQQASLKSVARRLKDVADAPSPEGRLTLEELDNVAKGFGLSETRRLLYSLDEKSQLMDALRVVFPFGEAWREVLTRWAKLGTENPMVAYRADQAANQGEGVVFHPDPQTGNEMISFPGSRWVGEQLTGVPFATEIPVRGLNMFGNILPGVGPVVSIPAGKLIPDTPKADVLRDLILPFGESDLSAGALESFLPSWVKKAITAMTEGGLGSPANKRQLASTTRDVMAYLYSTGDYDLSTPEGQDRLIEDAKDKAISVYFIRAIEQSTLPASPTTKMFGEDKDGRLRTLYLLAQDYRKMQQQDYQTATERFLDKYGDFAFLTTIGKTTGNVAPTKPVNDLARAHPEVARRYPTVFGYFAPGGEIDPGEITRQLDAGTRQEIGPQDAVTLANVRIANAIYYQAKAKVGDNPSPEQQAWLREVRSALSKKYPGYSGQPHNLAAGADQIAELQRAVKDPTLAGTDAGKGLSLYLEARDRALASAQAAGYAGFDKAKATAPLREWLRQVAAAVTKKHPAFGASGGMWERVFSKEVGEQ